MEQGSLPEDAVGMRVAPGAMLLGVTVEGPEPIGVVHLAAREGSTILYGRNGAGKSTLLGAVSSGFGGVHGTSTCLLHYRVRTEDDGDWMLGGAPLASLVREWADNRAADLLSAISTRPSSAAGASALLAAHWLRSAGLGAEQSRSAADGIVEGGYLTLRGSGTADAPSWEVFIAAQVNDVAVAPIALASERSWRDVLRLSGLDTMSGVSAGERRELLGTALERYEVSIDRLAAGGRESLLRPALTASYEAMGFAEPPGWVPRSVAPLGTLSADEEAARLIPYLILEDLADMNELTRAALARYVAVLGSSEVLDLTQLTQPLMTTCGDVPPVAEPVVEYLTALTADANNQLRDLLDDAPSLRCALRPVDEWLTSCPVQWEAFDAPRQHWIAVELLSQAQRRWSSFAIRSALARRERNRRREGRGRSVAVIDEPEMALHPLAQRKLFGSLLPVSWVEPGRRPLERVPHARTDARLSA